jgi:hypothetical protein
VAKIDFQWLSVTFSDFLSDFQWHLVTFSDFQWLSVTFSDFQWLSVTFSDFQWLSWPAHLLDEGVSSREDASTSWPSSSGLRGRRRTYLTILESADNALFKMVRYVFLLPLSDEQATFFYMSNWSNLAKHWCCIYVLECNINVATLSKYKPELFGRPSPSPSPRTSLKSADSDFENTSDSDSACLFVCLRIYTVKKSTFHKKIPKFQFFLF